MLIDYKNMVLDKERQSVSFLKPGMKIDLGGIAKGYAVDRAVQALTDLGIRHAQVAAGGDMRMLGDRLGRPWRIGIRDPRNQGISPLPYFSRTKPCPPPGLRKILFKRWHAIHHIHDPGPGDSAREVSSVSILGPDAITTDSLSTSVFVHGIEKGLQLINGLESVEGVHIDRKGKFHYSEHFKQYIDSRRRACRRHVVLIKT